MAEDTLAEVRVAIDRIDKAILQLLRERAQCAERVAEIKLASDADAVFYRPEREAQILARIARDNPGPLPDRSVQAIYKEIISSCLALEQVLQVACLGPAGGFTDIAARRHFGHGPELQPLASIEDVFRQVESGRARYGVVPLEDSRDGGSSHVVDFLCDSPLYLCGEIVQPLQHSLIGADQPLDAVQKVVGHPQSLAACRRFLDTHLPQAEREQTVSTGLAVQCAQQQPDCAAVAPEAAAKGAAMATLARDIDDQAPEAARYLVLGDREIEPSGHDVTSVILSFDNRPGALHRVLTPLAESGLDMINISSRRVASSAWRDVFFLDIGGHAQEPAVAAVLDELRRNVLNFRVAGAYPKAMHP